MSADFKVALWSYFVMGTTGSCSLSLQHYCRLTSMKKPMYRLDVLGYNYIGICNPVVGQYFEGARFSGRPGIFVFNAKDGLEHFF